MTIPQLVKYIIAIILLLPIIIPLRLIRYFGMKLSVLASMAEVKLNLFASWFLNIGSYDKKDQLVVIDGARQTT